MVEQASSTSNGDRGGWAIPAGKKPVWSLRKVEEVPRKVPARGIEVWWAEEGDRR